MKLLRPIILIGLAIRLTLFFTGPSHVAESLFVPFLDTSVRNMGSNPWSLMPPEYFPYGSMLWMILIVPRFLAHLAFGEAALGTGFLGLALIKLPLLAIDITLFASLVYEFRARARKIAFYYWLNPILIYITYIHCQFDLAAVAFVMWSLMLLRRQRYSLSALLLGFAILCKFHVVILVPFLLGYIWNRNFMRKALIEICKWTAVCFLVTALGFWPHFKAGVLAYTSTTSPEALRVFASRVTFSETEVLFPGLLLVLFVLGRLVLATRISERSLWLGAGALFASLVLITNPMPGWFFWFVPFISVLYASSASVPRSLYILMCLAYFLYFCLNSALLGVPESIFKGTLLTLLQGTTAATLFAFFIYGLRNEAPVLGRVRPVLLGLSGDSGSGKNRLSSTLSDLFSPSNTLVIEGDDYHRWERGDEAWQKYTHLNPSANRLQSLHSHTRELLKGGTISQPEYDHSTGRFTEPKTRSSARMIIVQGLHSLYLRGLRRNFDLKIFLDPHPLVRLKWKLDRDVKQRGKKADDVLKSLKDRDKDSQAHISPQRGFADWIVSVAPTKELSVDQVLTGFEFKLKTLHYVWNDIPLEDLSDELSKLPDVSVQIYFDSNDLNRIILSFEGELNAHQVQEIALRLFPQLRQITRSWFPPRFVGGFDGLNQLVALTILKARLIEGAS